MEIKKPKFFKKTEEETPATRRKRKALEEVRAKKLKRIGKIMLIIWIMLGTTAILALIYLFFTTYEFRSPIVKKEVVEQKIISPLPDEPEATESAEQEDELSFIPQAEASERLPVSEVLYKGKVSHYSNAGCLGCPEHIDENGEVYFNTGNGERFDEMAMTLAIPCEDITSGKHKYNTKVLVTNLDNGKNVEARITDCGGFSKYNRIADLSLGMAMLLETKTDVTNVKIELL